MDWQNLSYLFQYYVVDLGEFWYDLMILFWLCLLSFRQSWNRKHILLLRKIMFRLLDTIDRYYNK